MRFIFRICQRFIFRSHQSGDTDYFTRMNDDLADRLKRAIELRKSNPRAVSVEAEMSPDAVRGILRNPNSSPTVETVRKIAGALEVDPAWLAFNAGEEPSEEPNWISKGLEQPGKSPVALAKLLFKAPAYVKALAAGKAPSPKEIEIVSQYLGVEPPKAEEPSTSETNDNHLPGMVSLKIIGEVAAGVWLDTEADEFVEEEIELPEDPRFPSDKQFVLRVRGTSINKKAPHGALVRCLNLFAAPREPTEGDWVVARRQRGRTYETTVKELRSGPKGMELWPSSTDPKWQESVPLVDGDGSHEETSVVITAFVLDFINPATRF
jgi:SOS-response transcriptional repressor LexA